MHLSNVLWNLYHLYWKIWLHWNMELGRLFEERLVKDRIIFISFMFISFLFYNKNNNWNGGNHENCTDRVSRTMPSGTSRLLSRIHESWQPVFGYAWPLIVWYFPLYLQYLSHITTVFGWSKIQCTNVSHNHFLCYAENEIRTPMHHFHQNDEFNV